VLVRPFGRQGTLHAYSVRTGARRYTLPPGILSADGRAFISSAAAKAPRTTVARYDVRSGRLVRGRSLRGRGWSPAGVTADGRHVALVRTGRHVTVLRVGASRTVLRGLYEVEALSPDGNRVFLVHWKRNGYDLQQFDLATQELAPTRLDEPDEKMTGTAVSSVASRDGHWLLTLYIKPDGHSFVHALNLRSGLAHCIDLTLAGDLFVLGSTVLSLSPDEGTLYLANPYLGRVTSVDLARLEQTRVVRFAGLSPGNVNMMIGPSAASTPNGRMLAFTGQKSVWLYDTAFGIVRRAMSLKTSVTGLGFTPDGRQLLVLQRNGPLVFLDAASGKRL
jgi:WD40 repeat protein